MDKARRMKKPGAAKRRFALIPAIACTFLLVLNLATTGAWHVDGQDTPLLELTSATLDANIVFEPTGSNDPVPVLPGQEDIPIGLISIDVKPSTRIFYEITLTTESDTQAGSGISDVIEHLELEPWLPSAWIDLGILAKDPGNPGDYDWDPGENIAKFYGCIPEGSSVSALFGNVFANTSADAERPDAFTVTADFRACQATFEAVKDIFGSSVATVAGAAGILLNNARPVGIPDGTTYAWLSLNQSAQVSGHIVDAGRFAPDSIEIPSASSIRNESASGSGIAGEAPGIENGGGTGNSGSGINAGDPPNGPGNGNGDTGGGNGDPPDGSGSGKNASGNENIGEPDHE